MVITASSPIRPGPHKRPSTSRYMLSTSLISVISQQLVRKTDNKGRLPAIEILINNTAVSNLIREGKIDQIENVIQSGAMVGMQRMDSALMRMVDANLITPEEAYFKARNKADFEHLLDGREIIENAIIPDQSQSVNVNK